MQFSNKITPLWVEAALRVLQESILPPGRHSQGKENSLASKCWLDNSLYVLLWLDYTQDLHLILNFFIQGFKWDHREIGWTKFSTMGIILVSLSSTSAFGKSQEHCLKEI